MSCPRTRRRPLAPAAAVINAACSCLTMAAQVVQEAPGGGDGAGRAGDGLGGGAGLVVGPPLFPDTIADAIIDAETGCLLRLISYAGDAPVIWSELDDISTEPAGPDEFRVHVPPGTRTVKETGNWVVDEAAAMPGLAGTAVRAAAETINRTIDAVSAARTFLDDLRGHR